MGATEDEPGSDPESEGPAHRVRVSEFSLAATVTTNVHYELFDPAHRIARRPVAAETPLETMPVVSLTGPECWLFAEWMDARLPSEAEWEYACRAGTTTPYNTGETIDTELAAFDGREPCPGGESGIYHAWGAPVRAYPPNAWGLYEMHGSVAERCADAFHIDYVGAPTDGSPWGDGLLGEGIARGLGPFDTTWREVRSAARGHSQAMSDRTSLRLARG